MFLAILKPYIFAVLPAGSVPTSQVEGLPATAPSTFVPSPVVEIRSSLSLSPVQTTPFPPASTLANPQTTSATHTVRLLTPSPSSKSPLFVVSTPTDRTAAANAGSSIWRFRMKPWIQQIDELVEAGSYKEALALLGSLDVALVADKVRSARLSFERHFQSTHCRKRDNGKSALSRRSTTSGTRSTTKPSTRSLT